MPTLRRILKYALAVVLGLMIVVWVVGWLGMSMLQIRWTTPEVFVYSRGGSYTIGFYNQSSEFHSTLFEYQGFAPWRIFGSFYLEFDDGGLLFQIPQLIAITTFFPLAIGPFLSFRFRLWHYLAYTALVAVELAYYLRWQA